MVLSSPNFPSIFKSRTNFAIADLAAPDEVRPPFHFLEDLGQVFSQDTDPEEVERAEEKDQQQGRGDTRRHAVGKEDPAECLKQGDDKAHAQDAAPMNVIMFNGVLLKLRIPFLAQSRFLSRLLVLRPNIRSGLT